MQMKAAVGTVLALAGATALLGTTAEAGVRVVHRTVVRRPLVVARPFYVAPRPVYVAPAAVVVAAPLLRVSAGEVVGEPSGHGRLHVNVDPERARVYVDGRYEGRGDVTRTLREGEHTVRVVLNDGRQAAETVRVEAGRLSIARLDLNG